MSVVIILECLSDMELSKGGITSSSYSGWFDFSFYIIFCKVYALNISLEKPRRVQEQEAEPCTPVIPSLRKQE